MGHLEMMGRPHKHRRKEPEPPCRSPNRRQAQLGRAVGNRAPLREFPAILRLMPIWADKSASTGVPYPFSIPWIFVKVHNRRWEGMEPPCQLAGPRSLEGALLIGGWVPHGPGMWRGEDDPDPVLAESRPGLALRS